MRAGSMREQCPEVRIGRQHHAPLGSGAVEDHVVLGRREVIGAHVDRVVPGRQQAVGHQRREGVVDTGTSSRLD
jgi:hypothetical protein